MLDKEKEEINKWLCTKYPEVFVQGAIEKLAKKIEEKEKSFLNAAANLAEKIRDKERPVVVENDLVQHLTNRIDQYLYKRWPEVFVDENFKSWKSDLESKYAEVYNAKNLIVARFQEWEKKNESTLKNLDQMLIQCQKSINYLNEQITIPWWKRWMQNKN